jgi:hypothetical protein
MNGKRGGYRRREPEFYAADVRIGAMKTSVIFGVLLILSAFGIVSFYAVSWAERLLCPWYIPLDNDAPAAERNESPAAPELC